MGDAPSKRLIDLARENGGARTFKPHAGQQSSLFNYAFSRTVGAAPPQIPVAPRRANGEWSFAVEAGVTPAPAGQQTTTAASVGDVAPEAAEEEAKSKRLDGLLHQLWVWALQKMHKPAAGRPTKMAVETARRWNGKNRCVLPLVKMNKSIIDKFLRSRAARGAEQHNVRLDDPGFDAWLDDDAEEQITAPAHAAPSGAPTSSKYKWSSFEKILILQKCKDH